MPTAEPDLGHASEGTAMSDEFTINGRAFGSRLILGTGRYTTPEAMRAAVDASQAEMVTLAVRLVDFDAPTGKADITEALPDDVLLLPNTAGAQTAEEAVRFARLARAGGLPAWVKLEVIPDQRYLLPDPVGTLEAAEELLADGFTVLPYINADPVLAARLEELGCHAVMPLGSPIGSGGGLKLRDSIRIIVEQATVPGVVDAGLGAPSHAAEALELGADAVLVNTAIAVADNPTIMADAFRLAVLAGRRGYLAGLMEERERGTASSPTSGLLGGS
jgi:thiazole synthase